MSDNKENNSARSIAKALFEKMFPNGIFGDEVGYINKIADAVEAVGLMRPEDTKPTVKHDDKILNLSRLNENQAVIVVTTYAGGMDVKLHGEPDALRKFEQEYISIVPDPEGSFTLKGRRNGDLWEVTPYGDMIAFDDWKQFLIDMTPVDLCPANVGIIRTELQPDGSIISSEIGNQQAISQYKTGMFGVTASRSLTDGPISDEFMTDLIKSSIDYMNGKSAPEPDESELDHYKRVNEECNATILQMGKDLSVLHDRLRTAEILENFWRNMTKSHGAQNAAMRDRFNEMGKAMDALSGRTPF